MKGKLLILWLVIFTSCVFAQTWVRHLEWEDLVPAWEQNPDANAYNVIPAVDGGYIMHGVVTIHNYVDEYTNVFWKVTQSGDVVWRNDQPTFDNTPMTCLVSNGIDKYYGLSSQYHRNILYTYDAQLNPINSIMIDTLLTNGEQIKLLAMIDVDDGLIFGGHNRLKSFIIKLNYDYNLQWAHTLNSLNSTDLRELTNSPYDGFIGVGQKDLIRFNSNGDTLWVYQHPTSLHAGYPAIYNNDGTISFIGYMDSISVVRFTDNGELISFNPFQLAYQYSDRGAIIPTDDGCILLFERRYTQNVSNVGMLHKISQLGEVIWSNQVLSYTNYNNAGHGQNSIFEDDDGYYVMAIDDFIIVRSDSNGNAVSNNDPYTDTPGIVSVHAYPNPAKDRINFAFSGLPRSIKLSMSIYNLRGQLVDLIEIEDAGEQQWELPFGLGNGVYFFNIVDCGKLLYSGKFTIIR